MSEREQDAQEEEMFEDCVGNPSDASPTHMWGVFDTVDNVWMGDDVGPKLFADKIVNGKLFPGELQARIAAQMVDMQLGQVARCYAKLFEEESVRYRDEKPTRYGAEEALKRMEDGRLS